MFIPVGFTKEDIPKRGLVFHVDFNDLASYANDGNYIRSTGKNRLFGTAVNDAIAGKYNRPGRVLDTTFNSGIYFESGSNNPEILSDEITLDVVFRLDAYAVNYDRSILVSKEGCYELSINNFTGRLQHSILTENNTITYQSEKMYIPSTGTYRVTGFESTTNIYKNGTFLQNLTNGGVPADISFNQGDTITSNKPIGIIGSGFGDQPAFSSWAGTEFMWYVKRPTNYIFIAAPVSASNVDIYQNGVFLQSVSIAKDGFHQHTQGSAQVLTIKSDYPVCISQVGSSDKFSVHPVAKELYGWNSRTIFMYAPTGSPQTEVYINNSSNNTLSPQLLLTDTGSYTTTTTNAPAGSSYSGYPVYVSSSNNNFFFDTYADQDGSDQTSWVPKSVFATKFILPDSVDHLAFLSTGGEDLEVRLYNYGGIQTEVHNSGVSQKGTSDYVSGVYLGAYGEGTIYAITNKPAYCVYDQSSSDDESILPGAYTYYSTGSDLRDGQWHKATITKKGDQEKIYVDGELIGSFTTIGGKIRSLNNGLSIGGSGGDNTLNTSFSGDIASVSVYNRALSPNEVLKSYNYYSSRILNLPAVEVGEPTVQAIASVAYVLDAFNPSSLNSNITNVWYDVGGETLDNHASMNAIQDADNNKWDFNGSNHYGSVANDILINENGSSHARKTLSAWVNVKRSPTDEEDVIYEQGGVSNGISIYTYSGSLWTGMWSDATGWGSYTNPGVNGVFHSGSINLNQWYHIFIGLQPSGSAYKVTSYLNGVEIGDTEVPSSLNEHSGDIAIGRSGDGARSHFGNFGAGLYFSGSISFLKQTNSTHTLADVVEEFNEYSASYGY